MQPRSRIVAAVAFLVAGAVLAVAGFFSGALGPAHAAAVGFLGLVIVALGALLLRARQGGARRGFRPRSPAVLYAQLPVLRAQAWPQGRKMSGVPPQAP